MTLVHPDDWRPQGVDDLEPRAWQALKQTDSSVLVTAGAGAGKTEFLAQKPGEKHFIKIRRQGENRGKHGRRVSANGDGDFHALLFALGQSSPVVLSSLFVRLPVHTGRALIVDLEPVHAYVSLAVDGIL